LGSIALRLQRAQKSYPDRRVEVIVQEGVVVQGDPIDTVAIENLMTRAGIHRQCLASRIEFARPSGTARPSIYPDNGVGFDMAMWVNCLAPSRLPSMMSFRDGIGRNGAAGHPSSWVESGRKEKKESGSVLFTVPS